MKESIISVTERFYPIRNGQILEMHKNQSVITVLFSWVCAWHNEYEYEFEGYDNGNKIEKQREAVRLSRYKK